jgi:hypothetical protein
MKIIKTFNQYQTNEGWKENVLAGLSLASNVAYTQPNINYHTDTPNKIEMTQSDDKKFYSACFQLCQELKGSKLEFDQYKGIVEAQYYFQSLRDGEKPRKLSQFGKAAVKSVMNTVMSMDQEEMSRLSKLGESGKLTANW